MSELRQIADRFDAILQDRKLEKYSYTFSESEKQEMNVEDGGFKLMRTVFNNNGSLSVYLGTKVGAVNGNDLSEEGLEKLVSDGIAAAESAAEDPCHDFGPDQGKDVFRQGIWEPDMDLYLERVKEFLDAAAKEFPKVKIMAAIASYDRWNWISRNTNGTEFEGFGGQYSFFIEICAGEGEKTTGIDGTGFVTKDLSTPFMEMADVRQHMIDVQNSINTESVDGKFEGTIILTPGCAANFISMIISNYVGSGVIINGTSQWLDKVGEKVADEKLTISLDPYDDRIVMGERATSDGFRSEAVTIIDKGVLKTHLLGLYAANKTGRPLVKNSGFDLVVEPGEKSLAELIASVDKGLVMGGFSGGQPGANGEFSGVAKNSFLIENGKIKCAVSETMVNGNLGDAIKNIRGISKEILLDGTSAVPYIALDGIIISGK
ncbi:MAG: TldD/PmbA family protein [Lachnospiraceae bacterium]|nr:TldD/PmbA family protein [Lachnospiraceae bacterium]